MLDKSWMWKFWRCDSIPAILGWGGGGAVAQLEEGATPGDEAMGLILLVGSVLV